MTRKQITMVSKVILLLGINNNLDGARLMHGLLNEDGYTAGFIIDKDGFIVGLTVYDEYACKSVLKLTAKDVLK